MSFSTTTNRARLLTSTLFGILAVLVAGSASPASAAPSRNTQKTSPPLVHLPADQAAHNAAANEWWYVVGHLRAGRRTFGFEVTLFKFAHVRPPGFAAPVSVYRTDLAITDEGAKRFYHSIAYYFPQSARLSRRTLDVHIGRASLAGPSLRSMRLRGSFGGSAIDLHLASLRAPMYVGGRGYLTFANGYTYYYSLTDLRTSGALRVAGVTYAVTGTSWLDHQWGNWSWTSVRGWTWMAWQLDDGVQLSVFDFRSTVGRVRAASVLLSNGHLMTVRNVSFRPLGTWRSPHTSGVYPSGWLVRIPALRVAMRVEPTVRDQEMTVPGESQASYWEGSSRVSGTFQGKRVSGLGYTELTGYAR
jgi:predicted secreted hydrolase